MAVVVVYVGAGRTREWILRAVLYQDSVRHEWTPDIASGMISRQREDSVRHEWRPGGSGRLVRRLFVQLAHDALEVGLHRHGWVRRVEPERGGHEEVREERPVRVEDFRKIHEVLVLRWCEWWW